MEFEFEALLINWRGPAPFIFAPIPQEISAAIRDLSPRLTYGWGCIPVRGRIGKTSFKTALFPKDGIYLLPVKAAVQRAESLGEGDSVSARIEFELK